MLSSEIGNLASIVHLRIRVPLNGILGNAEVSEIAEDYCALYFIRDIICC